MNVQEEYKLFTMDIAVQTKQTTNHDNFKAGNDVDGLRKSTFPPLKNTTHLMQNASKIYFNSEKKHGTVPYMMNILRKARPKGSVLYDDGYNEEPSPEVNSTIHKIHKNELHSICHNRL